MGSDDLFNKSFWSAFPYSRLDGPAFIGRSSL